MPDTDAAEDAASKRDVAAFRELAAALCVRQEAIVVTERHGPHLVLLPAAPGSCALLLREIASRDTLLPAPAAAAVPRGHITGDAWTCALLDPLSVTAFNPQVLGGSVGTSNALPTAAALPSGIAPAPHGLRRVCFK
jgi:hypothetical protein